MELSIMRRAVGLVPWRLRSIVKYMPGVAQFQRALLRATLNGKTFVHTVDAGPARGVRFEIMLPDDKGIWTGTYEAHFASRVAAAVKPGSVCYDIGGWHGFFAGVFAAQGAAEVHVFEPLPSNITRIQRMIALNPALPLRLHALAAGDGARRMDLLVMPASSMAKLVASSFQPEATTTECVSVDVQALDDLIASGAIPPADVIKLDVEGAEGMVLRGATRLLATQRAQLFIEAHSSTLRAECEQILRSFGYTVACVDCETRAVASRDVFTLHAFVPSVHG